MTTPAEQSALDAFETWRLAVAAGRSKASVLEQLRARAWNVAEDLAAGELRDELLLELGPEPVVEAPTTTHSYEPKKKNEFLVLLDGTAGVRALDPAVARAELVAELTRKRRRPRAAERAA